MEVAEGAPPRTVLLKIGGAAAENERSLADLANEMLALSKTVRLVLVHGGGAEVTSLSRRLGIEAVFDKGVRQTSPAEMDIVDMVLSGKLNKRLVRLLRTRGLNAVGLSGSDGGVFTGSPVGESRTGSVAGIDDRLLTLLLANGYLPVLSSTSMDARGGGLNINADSVAFSLAAHLRAWALVFLSDIPGILCDGEVLSSATGERARSLIDQGVITGGMIPKVSASLQALKSGVGKVIIGSYAEAGSLSRLLEGSTGTRIEG